MLFRGSLIVFASSISAALARANERAYKLEIHKESGAKVCTFLSIIETQPHKGLRREEIVEETPSPLDNSGRSGTEYFKLYSHQLPLLLQRAESHCGSRSSWSFDTLILTDSPHGNSRSSPSEDASKQSPLNADLGWSAISSDAVIPKFEVVPLFTTGHSSNRVDITFFGDGYTENERDKFLSDAKSLALDISYNHTFLTVRPLLNFWAAFAASNETGIGIGGEPKDTIFGLYRDGTELRAVYYAKPEVAATSCDSLGDGCDYPILLANDPLYGGLGGRFTVTTSSKMNGPLVLRHELGHSVIKEGEEYDGGFAYYGPNAAHNFTSPFPWAHWLSDGNGTPRAERSVMPMQAYPWTVLSLDEPWTVKFNSSGQYARHLVRFSLSAIPEAKHLAIVLDGEEIQWTPMPGIGVDRWHYDVHRNETLADGEHTLSFSLQEGALVGLAQLCSAEIIEFGDADEFNATEGHISAYPTYSDKNETSYRPTNEGCLMRVVTSPDFCKVCVEGLWHVLLERVNLIDDISTDCTHVRTINLDPVKLGQLRSLDADEGASLPQESLSIIWAKDGTPLPHFENKTKIVLDAATTGNFTVVVQFFTEEVRVDPRGFLKDTGSIEINTPCRAIDEDV